MIGSFRLNTLAKSIAQAFSTSGGTDYSKVISGVEYLIHTFTTTGSNNFTVTGTGTVDVLLVGGGGAGGGIGSFNTGGGGGGGGGAVVYQTGVAVTGQTYTISVGTAGAGVSGAAGGAGVASTGLGYTANGGGAGTYNTAATNGGGSGANGSTSFTSTIGTYAYKGGNSFGSATVSLRAGGGGAGAGATGQNAATSNGGNGGNGVQNNIDGNNYYYGSGGGGAGATPGQGYTNTGTLGSGFTYGGGNGGTASNGYPASATNAQYGGGGGGARVTTSGAAYSGGAGKQGIVIIRRNLGNASYFFLNHKISGSTNEMYPTIAVDKYGNIFTVYQTLSYAYLVKCDSFGVTKWEVQMSGSGLLPFVTIDSDNQVQVMLKTSSSGPIDIQRYDNSTGSLLTACQVYFGTSGTFGQPQYTTGITSSTDGYIYLALESSTVATPRGGYTVLPNSLASATRQVQISAGITDNSLSFGPGYNQLSTGNSYAVYSNSSNTLYVSTYTSAGSLTQTYKFSTLQSNMRASINNGYVYFISAGGSTVLTVGRISSGTTVDWAKVTTQTIFVNGVICADDSGNTYILVKNSSSTNIMYVMKLDTSGTQLWQLSITLPAGESPTVSDITVREKLNAVYLSFYAPYTNQGQDSVVLKLPLDGSKTGTYTVDGKTIVIATSTTVTWGTATVTAATQTTTSTSTAPGFTASTTSYTSTSSTTPLQTLTTI